MAYLKIDLERSDSYLSYIRSLPCLACGRPSVAHHTSKRGEGGIGLKGSDYRAVNLCPDHHQEGHQIGWQTWQAKHNIDLKEAIVNNLIGYVKKLEVKG